MKVIHMFNRQPELKAWEGQITIDGIMSARINRTITGKTTVVSPGQVMDQHRVWPGKDESQAELADHFLELDGEVGQFPCLVFDLKTAFGNFA